MPVVKSKIEAILHPVRAQLLVALQDRPLTPRELAALIPKVPLGTIYRHVNVLHAAGLIEVVRERRVHGTVERQFGVVHSAQNLSASDRNNLDGDQLVGLVTALGGVMQSAFERYAAHAQMPPKDGEVMFNVSSLYLTDAEYATFRSQVRDLNDKVGREPGPRVRRRFIGTFSVPDVLSDGRN
jgi:DNA-binding transcriptional ArsR family regulator